MGLFTRFSDIVNSNLNAMLDKAENPERMLAMVIQEMEQTIVDIRTASARTIADKKELQRRTRDLNAAVIHWQEKAKLAINKGRDDLAKAALAEKNQRQTELDKLQSELEKIESDLNKLDQDLSTLQEKLTDAKSRRNAVLNRQKNANVRLNIRKREYQKDIDEALVRFERFEQKMDRVEAEIESYDMGQSKSLGQQIDELAKDESINDELEALKSKLKKAS